MKTKNYFLELLRFIFCLIIFMHHSGFLVSDDVSYPFKAAGFFAVEFFFILSGVLLMNHIDKRIKQNSMNEVLSSPMEYSMKYTLGKLKRVWPYAAVGVILSYVWYFLQVDSSLGIKDKIFGRWNIVFELLFIPMTGVMSVDLTSYLNTPLWYLSVILIALPLVLYLAIKFSDLFNNYLSWVIPLLIHGYLISKYGSIGNWGVYTGVVYSGVLRGIADLMLGAFVFALVEKLSYIIDKNKSSKIIATFLEIILYIFAIYTFSSNVDGYTYEAAVLFLTLAIGISFSGKTYTGNIKGEFFLHLGKLSLPIYCLHWPVYRFMTLYAKGFSYVLGVLITFIICILLSELLMLWSRKNG